MNVAILGYGAQGQSAAEYWYDQENQITVCDANAALEIPEQYAAKLGDDYLDNLEAFDLIIRSPSIHPGDITRANTSEILAKVTTNTNEFFKVCPTKNIIGVTGTKGKGTTSTLITKMLEAAGHKVHLGGNIGTPPLELLKNDIQADDWVVLELANFQLIDLKYSPRLAICLMIAPEHQDWHQDVAEYMEAKQQLFRWQTAENTAIYYALSPNSKHIASISPGQKLPYMSSPGADVIENKLIINDQIICDVSEIKLLGKHNWQNICAATTAVWQNTRNIEAIRSVVASFSGMEYRLELTRELNGVKFYNDSFGTTPETAIVAIQAFTEPKIIILGGSDKGAKYTELANVIAENNVRKVLLIGEQASRIQAALETAGFSDFEPGGSTMDEIVRAAQDIAQAGDVVLLSTACASFDMFKNYKDRGDQFSAAVQSLA